VRAANDLFCSRGYLGTTISEVAKHAGLAVPADLLHGRDERRCSSKVTGHCHREFRRVPRAPNPARRSPNCCPGISGRPSFQAAPTSDVAFDIQGVGRGARGGGSREAPAWMLRVRTED
jgi:hypothetical protein